MAVVRALRASVGIAVSCGGGTGGGAVEMKAELVKAGADGITGAVVVTVVVVGMTDCWSLGNVGRRSGRWLAWV